MARTSIAVIVLAVAAVAGAYAPVTLATFPGANGRIAFTTELFPGDCGECDAEGQMAWVATPGERPTRLGPSSWQPRIAFSPTGARLLYQDRQGAVVLVRPDGSGRRPLSGPGTVDLAWSPLGDTVAYTDSSGVTLVSADGGAPRPIFAGADTADVVWSPTATRLAFTQYAPGGPRIRVIRSDGRPLRELGRGYALDWSSSGWLSYRRGTSLLAVRPGQNREKVLVSGLNPVEFDTRDYRWSPDGRHVAFEDNDHLWVQRVAGGAKRQITRRPAFSILGWSPDGRLVAYEHSEGIFDRSNGIYTVSSRGGRSKLLLRYPRAASGEYAMDFDWQPRPGGRR